MSKDYYDWLRDADRSPEEIKERWSKIGIVIPMKRWKEICEFNEGLTTWDTLVECELSSEEGDVVIGLGFYGHAVKNEHARLLYNGMPWKENAYTVTYHGVDGSEEMEFETIEHARTFVKKYVGDGAWCTSDTAFHTDYAHYYCHGFKLSDLDLKWQEHVA